MRFFQPTPWTVLCLCAIVAATLGQAAADDEGAVRTDMLRSTEWVAERLGGEDLVIIHVAEAPDQYAEAHVPGARFLPWEALAAEQDGAPGMLPPARELVETFEALGASPEKTIVLYDEDGGFRAARAYLALAYLGAEANAALMDGHWPLWVQEGRPTADEPAPHETDALEVSLRPIIAGYPMMRDIVWAHESGRDRTRIFDARPPDQYTGEEPGPGITRAGHIPGARNVFWRETVVSPEEPVFRPADELRALYGDLEGERIVTYCRTGGQGAHAFFTLRYLGFDPVLYDGSYIEWQARPDTETVTGE